MLYKVYLIDCSGVHRHEVEPHLLIETAGDVEVLDGLASRTLDKVVDGGEHNHAVRALVDVPGDVAEVRAPDFFRRRIAAAAEQPDEELLAVGLSKAASTSSGVTPSFRVA